MEEQRRVVDLLDVQVTIVLEADVPVAQVRCRLSPAANPLPINTSSPQNCCVNPHWVVQLKGRLPLAL